MRGGKSMSGCPLGTLRAGRKKGSKKSKRRPKTQKELAERGQSAGIERSRLKGGRMEGRPGETFLVRTGQEIHRGYAECHAGARQARDGRQRKLQ